MLARGDLALEADIVSDTAPLHGLIEDLLAAAPATRWLRDSTRGGVGTVCNELARDADVTVVLEESPLPVRPAVAAACELLGHRPSLRGQRGQARRRGAARGGRRGAGRPERAIPWAPTPCASERSTPSLRASWCCAPSMGGTRIVDMLVGDPLPRIC